MFLERGGGLEYNMACEIPSPFRQEKVHCVGISYFLPLGPFLNNMVMCAYKIHHANLSIVVHPCTRGPYSIIGFYIDI
jgi:hypothetical protein